MAKILIHSDSASSATSVSNIFIDEYMSDAVSYTHLTLPTTERV